MADLQSPKGTHDILPKDHEYFTYLKKIVRHRCRQSGFRRISTPIFEHQEVFTRSVGEATDIVSKEMYAFQDKKGRKLALKPEGTAGVVRAYLQNGMPSWPQPVQLYYIEPHFRYDRPQKGRFRQFHQWGVELFGADDAAIDAQIIYLGWQVLKDLGLGDDLSLQINNIGTAETRKEYIEELKNFYLGKGHVLSEEDKKRVEENPLRLLDSKDEDLIILAQLAPKITDYISDEDKKHYERLKGFLDALGLEYTENPTLVRGLDYYTRTVFEFWDKTEGQQNAVLGGGRYDDLVELMGGQPTPAIGFAMGVERVINNMKDKRIVAPHKDDVHIFLCQLGFNAKKKSLQLLEALREEGFHVMGAMGEGSMRTQVGLADKFKAKYALIMGEIEVKDGLIIVRDMAKGEQSTMKYDKIIPHMKKVLGKELDKLRADEKADDSNV
jgi:histidyl-tRNA synthetase